MSRATRRRARATTAVLLVVVVAVLGVGVAGQLPNFGELSVPAFLAGCLLAYMVTSCAVHPQRRSQGWGAVRPNIR